MFSGFHVLFGEGWSFPHLRPWRFLRKRSHPWAVWCDGHEHCKLTSLVRGIVWGIVWGPETSSMCCLLNSSFSYIYIYRGPRESRKFRGQDPEFILVNPFFQLELAFLQECDVLSLVLAKEDEAGAPIFWAHSWKKLSCFAEMWSQK